MSTWHVDTGRGLSWLNKFMKFYVVGTPIGNLEDITFRAVAVLSSVDLILCEDTRVTLRLLERYAIQTPTMSFHSQSKLQKVDKIISFLREGKNVALVSDAGTPTISDPGVILVAQIREQVEGIEIIAIPGPSAVVAALSIAGLPASDFLFLGFLPHKKGRMTLFNEIEESKRTVVFYESPHRIMKTLEVLAESLDGTRKVVVCREMTKVFEQVVIGTGNEVSAYFNQNSDKIRGEFVVIVGA